ncbi:MULTISPECIES: Wzt carbohydrate-binding domain-containing protein [Burkholderiaceae]|uniref:Wzt carbohydrate-binding domain-containing protein n=1 Tax=Burkholderiaceae TaxID=119060 RepID=UPI00142398C4|nr:MULTISPECIES: Wzt carbohydrate-binding domain-containing protein [Burkholderiaceae]MBN3849916.1 hypothetical protein [Paraburkholderia sp. Ac-20342]NIF56124.1 hypothetical protein [Burkholderia sp. Ax-1724]
MKTNGGVYPGRIFVDHLPKTAGTALGAWLQSALGKGCVSDTALGNHQEVIRRFGGRYSVILSHTHFSGEDLDPRYEYITCLREPVDRAVSWLFFIVQNHVPDEAPEIFAAAQRILNVSEEQSEINEGDLYLLRQHVQHYVDHFYEICPGQGSRVDVAIGNFLKYAVWGFQEEMGALVSDIARLIGLEPPAALSKVNITKSRPDVENISPALRRKLESAFSEDIIFYNILKKKYAERSVVATESSPRRWDSWGGLKSFDDRWREDFILVSSGLRGKQVWGELLTFDLTFSVASGLSAPRFKFSIYDESDGEAFSEFNAIEFDEGDLSGGGVCEMHFTFCANFPEGRYYVNAEIFDRNVCIAKLNRIRGFRVGISREREQAGYLPVTRSARFSKSRSQPFLFVNDGSGRIATHNAPAKVSARQPFDVAIELANDSAQDWTGFERYPISISYRWLSSDKSVVVRDGLRTPFPASHLNRGSSVQTNLKVRAPEKPGTYILQIVPVQEMICWFDERGFICQDIEVEVIGELSIKRASGQPVGVPD